MRRFVSPVAVLPLAVLLFACTDDVATAPQTDSLVPQPARTPPSPAPMRLAYLGQQNGFQDILLINDDGSDPGAVTADSAQEGPPAWSPDGRWIAFSESAPESLATHIWKVGIDGTKRTQVTHDQGSQSQPTWAPDGARFAYALEAASGSGIFVANADGTSPHRITPGTTAYFQPAWSPDGTAIAFLGGTDIYVIAPDGSAMTQLTATPVVREWYPAWSPDGEEIAFARIDDAANTDNLFVMSADGTGIRQLTTFPPGVLVGGPAWSPDGQFLSFYANGGGEGFSIYLIHPDGTAQSRLQTPGTNVYNAAWAPLEPPRPGRHRGHGPHR